MTTLEYFPGEGFVFEGKQVNWGSDRSVVRTDLGVLYEEEDRIVDLSEYFEGGESYTIEQRRDFYPGVEGAYSLYLNYDEEDRLTEFEVHSGIRILVKGKELNFEADIYPVLVVMNDLGEQGIELEEGNYLFNNFKMTIASAAATGGEGNGLAYFYAAENVVHLLG